MIKITHEETYSIEQIGYLIMESVSRDEVGKLIQFLISRYSEDFADEIKEYLENKNKLDDEIGNDMFGIRKQLDNLFPSEISEAIARYKESF